MFHKKKNIQTRESETGEENEIGENAFFGDGGGGEENFHSFPLTRSLAHTHSLEATFYEKNGWRKLGNFSFFFFSILNVKQRKKGRLKWIKSSPKVWKNAWFRLAISRYGNWETFFFFISRYWDGMKHSTFLSPFVHHTQWGALWKTFQGFY